MEVWELKLYFLPIIRRRIKKKRKKKGGTPIALVDYTYHTYVRIVCFSLAINGDTAAAAAWLHISVRCRTGGESHDARSVGGNVHTMNECASTLFFVHDDSYCL